MHNEGNAVPRDDPPSASADAVTAPLKSAACALPVKHSNSPYSAAACPPSIPKSEWASMHWKRRRAAILASPALRALEEDRVETRLH